MKGEALRQRELLAAIDRGSAAPRTLRESGARAVRGLEAYRANAEAIAARALAACFATVHTMVGADDFAHLADEFRRAHPPQRGDLGEWGDDFPAWLAAHAGLAAWPWLADGARLDLALHRCERAADAALDTASLTLLETTDPARLRLVFVPGTALIESAWPIVSIHRAHQLEGEAAERAFAEVRAAIEAGGGESALVVRKGWRAVVHGLELGATGWASDLLAGTDLATALQRAGEDFDFATWLGTAIRGGWLQSVAVMRG